MGPDRHERLSPSSSSRWLSCPFSAQRGLPRFENEAATRGTDLHDLAGEVLTGKAGLKDVPEKHRAGVEMYVKHVRANGGDVAVERFWESWAIDEFGGTADCVIIQGNRAAIYDFKTGRWPVEAKDNPQLLCYASIVAEHFPITEFFGVIVQPNKMRGDKITVAEYPPAQVAAHRQRVAVAAVSDYKSVGDHCRFCPLHKAGYCSEGVAHARKMGW